MEFVIGRRVGYFEPNADVFIDDERGQLIVAVEVAGADPDSLRISIDDRYLSISGRRLEVSRFRRGSFIQKEIAHGQFTKRVYLPVAVDFGDVVASYADGVLIVALPVSTTAYLPTSRTEIRMTIKRTLS